MSVKTIINMVDWVERNLENEPTLHKMSVHVGYSEYYCSAKFHEYVGYSFKEYILKRKLHLAAAALLGSQDRILDIAVRYGFSSHEAFTRAFRKNYGCTPRQYRSQQPSVPLFEKIRI